MTLKLSYLLSRSLTEGAGHILSELLYVLSVQMQSQASLQHLNLQKINLSVVKKDITVIVRRLILF